MAIHRDSPGLEPETPEIDRAQPHRRFARLVESTGARRLSFSRLGLAIGLTGSVVVCVGFLVQWGADRIATWVASRPEQQILFSKIELVPEPGPWVKGGSALILEQVRKSSQRGETLPLLDLDPKALANDFRVGSAWIKRVVKLERLPGRIKIQVEYRQPVAEVVLERELGMEIRTIDEEGVRLDPVEIDWKSANPPCYLVKGIAQPLITIWGVDPRSEPRLGVPWEAVDQERKPIGPDLMVASAARLAAFLRDQAAAMPSGKSVPRIAKVFLPGEPTNLFVIKDFDDTSIWWGKPPGDEKPGELTSETRWKMLVEWVNRPGSAPVKRPGILCFTDDGIKVRQIADRPKK